MKMDGMVRMNEADAHLCALAHRTVKLWAKDVDKG